MTSSASSAQAQTSVPEHSSALGDIQGKFYDNIVSGGFWPTMIAIIIISFGLILEMGTFFGFLIPADLLLYTSGLILGANARRGAGILMLVVAIISAVVGDLIGYYRSNKVGTALYNRSDTWYFKKKHLYSAQAALEKYGDKIFYIGKFLHIRSFLPILAGVSGMNIVRFGLISVTSTIIWASATFIPSFLIGLFFPQLITSRWLLVVGTVIFLGTEAIAWIILFNQDIKSIARRLRDSHTSFAAIKTNFVDIKNHIGNVAEYVVKGDNMTQDTNRETQEDPIKGFDKA